MRSLGRQLGLRRREESPSLVSRSPGGAATGPEMHAGCGALGFCPGLGALASECLPPADSTPSL